MRDNDGRKLNHKTLASRLVSIADWAKVTGAVTPSAASVARAKAMYLQ